MENICEEDVAPVEKSLYADQACDTVRTLVAVFKPQAATLSSQLGKEAQNIWLYMVPNCLPVLGSDPDPKLLAGSGSGKNHSGNEFEVKLLWKTAKLWYFRNKNAQLKNINTFFVKKYFLKKVFISS